MQKHKDINTNKNTTQDVRSIYRIIRAMTGSLGGSSSQNSTYGELTEHSMQRIIDFLKLKTGFNENSSFLDLGSGLCKPIIHVAQDVKCVSVGIENVKDRYFLGLHNIQAVNTRLRKPLPCTVIRRDIEDIKSFTQFTHVYTFNEGFEPSLNTLIVKKCIQSKCKYVILYKSRTIDIPETWQNLGPITVRLHGASSNSQHTCHVFRCNEQKNSTVSHMQMKCRHIEEALNRIHYPSSNTSFIATQIQHITTEGRVTRSTLKTKINMDV
jgi:hypothetical protein